MNSEGFGPMTNFAKNYFESGIIEIANELKPLNHEA